MYVNELKSKLGKQLSNVPGWRTNRKIIVFESDDWGAIRMSSKKALASLQKQGVHPYDEDERRYLENDALASENDLSSLFDVLNTAKDSREMPAVFTALSLVANPDFKKIKDSGFSEYHYEPFTNTLERYPEHSRSFELWKEGIRSRLFVPQFHGREHLNVQNWLLALRQKNRDTMLAFDQGVYGITPKDPFNHVSYQAAFDFSDFSEVEYQKSVIKEGIDLFEKLLGYRPSFFVPTNGPFNNVLEQVCATSGISYMGTSKIQSEPIGGGKFKKHFHYIGMKNKYNQTYLTRNGIFEPSSNLKTDWIDACLHDISIAFRWHKPAVISTHRVNYIGWLNPANRDKGLSQLRTLLIRIIKHWPDVEFMTSVELAQLISPKK